MGPAFIRFKYGFMSFVYKVHRGLVNFLKRLLVLAELILFLRLVLKFLGANPYAFVVKELYKFTDAMVWPVNPIFPNFYWGERLVDVVAISAMVGYLLAFLIIKGVLKLFFHNEYAQ